MQSFGPNVLDLQFFRDFHITVTFLLDVNRPKHAFIIISAIDKVEEALGPISSVDSLNVSRYRQFKGLTHRPMDPVTTTLLCVLLRTTRGRFSLLCSTTWCSLESLLKELTVS